jgi:hypothetical protein
MECCGSTQLSLANKLERDKGAWGFAGRRDCEKESIIRLAEKWQAQK